jgi:hypothetical protein
MGSEVICAVQYDGTKAEAKVLLETEAVIVRAPFKLTIPFKEVREVRAEGHDLLLRWRDHEARLAIGKQAAAWAKKIANPKSVVEKIGIKPGQKVSIVGNIDEAFRRDLAEQGADVSSRLRRNSDVIFLAASARDALVRLRELRDSLHPAGSIWVIRPKGTDAIKDADVIAAGKSAGLVDVKVVRFSDTHTAEKLVIPVTKRSSPRPARKILRSGG